jgi:hypothetical protein
MYQSLKRLVHVQHHGHLAEAPLKQCIHHQSHTLRLLARHRHLQQVCTLCGCTRQALPDSGWPLQELLLHCLLLPAARRRLVGVPAAKRQKKISCMMPRRQVMAHGRNPSLIG